MIALLLCLASQVPPVSLDFMQETPQIVEVETKPLVILVTQPNCAPCVLVKNRLQRLDKTEVDFVIYDVRKWNQIAPGASVNTTPTVFVWKNREKPAVARLVGGGTTAKLVMSYLTEDKQTITRGKLWGQWTWPGSPSVAALERHLAGSIHRVDAARLQTMSDAELVQLHDSLHQSKKQVRGR